VGIRAEEGETRSSEAFEMNLVAYAVAGLAQDDAVLLGNALQVPVVICVPEVGLERVVIDIAHAQLSLYARDAQSFKLQVDQRARGVLGQGLIDP